MQLPSIQELQPYFAAVAAVLGVATLGFVIKFGLMMRDAARAQTDIIRERLENVVADLARTEKWAEREKQQLSSENEQLRSQLQELLADSGMTLEALAAGRSLKDVQQSISEALDALLSKMEDAQQTNGPANNPSWQLELAKAHMAKREWAKAASHFDAYVQTNPVDSDVQFSRGVAHANTRGGESENLAALRAYNEAIAFASVDLDNNMRARYHAYRGAMLKRMDRLSEAKADLNLAMSLADREYEINDIKYNLAAVYAMKGDRDSLMKMIDELQSCQRELNGIRCHLADYFAAFANDAEFLAKIGNE